MTSALLLWIIDDLFKSPKTCHCKCKKKEKMLWAKNRKVKKEYKICYCYCKRQAQWRRQSWHLTTIFIIANCSRSSNHVAEPHILCAEQNYELPCLFSGQKAESHVIWAARVWLAVSATQHGGLSWSGGVGIMEPWVVRVCSRHHQPDLTLQILGWGEAAHCPLNHQTRTVQEPVKGTEIIIRHYFTGLK